MTSQLLVVSALLAATAGLSVPDAHADEAQTPKLGHHPAVIVAQAWNARGIDPNTFIVAHPARLALVATSPSKQTEVQAAAVATVGR